MLHHFRSDPFFSFPSLDDHFDDFFSDFYSRPSLMNALTYDPVVDRRASSRDVALRNNRTDRHRSRDIAMFSPFDSMNAMMNDMNNMFGNISRHMEQGLRDGNGEMYTATSFMSYNNANGREPQYYEATSATRQGPHGLRETRKTERNSVTGYDKMAVGRHIHDRGHVMTKQRDRRTGQMEEHQDFQNIDEETAGEFSKEWQEKARRYFGYGRSGRGEVGYGDYAGYSRGDATRQHSNRDVRAIEDTSRDSYSPEDEDYERSRYEKQKKNKKEKKNIK